MRLFFLSIIFRALNRNKNQNIIPLSMLKVKKIEIFRIQDYKSTKSGCHVYPS